MQVKKQQLEPDNGYTMLQLEQNNALVQKLVKKYAEAVYCHPAYLTYMQNTSGEMLGWMKHNLESRSLGEISITSDMQMTSPSWQKMKRN